MIMTFLVKVVNHFLQSVLFLIVHRQAQLALFSPQYHALPFHAAHHVKRQAGLSAESHLKKVLLNTIFDRLAEPGLDLKIPVCRAQSADTLVRPLVVVIFHPLPYPLLSIFKTIELSTAQKLQEYRLPEPFYLPECHRMVRLGFNMMNPVFFQLHLKTGGSTPGRILPPIVRQHLTGRVILRFSPAVHLNNILRRLAAKQLQAGYVPGIIVNIPD
jgi:hypothetical protein